MGSPTLTAAFRPGPLLAWFDGRGRDLPWRRTRDPWRVLVSELMLQQTQVARVVPRYNELLERFPDPATCAAAPGAAVVVAWAGLGYNRRAASLHRCAVDVVERHDGQLPSDVDGLLALPGIGPYTARAVLAFAFEADVGVLDVNARRVLSRLLGAPVDQVTADAAVPPGRGWRWNQAVLDLGATICRPSPRCESCPLAGGACRWESGGRADPDPWVRGRGQSTFVGSDRQGRGRLVDALRVGPLRSTDVPAVAGWPTDTDRARRVAASLVADGLAVATVDGFALP